MSESKSGRKLETPEVSLILLVGASGCGKSTFAAKHFLETEVVSSDACRGYVADDELDQSATPAAFELLHFWVEQRLKGHRLTVVDATNVQKEGRAQLIRLAKKHHVLVTAIVFDVGEKVCIERNESREDRLFGSHVVKRQYRDLKRGLGRMGKEGFRFVYTLTSQDEVDSVEIVRTKMFPDKRELGGPFDIVGDVHGCLLEFEELLGALEYKTAWVDDIWKEGGKVLDFEHPEGRTLFLVGDLVDRGPDSVGVLKSVMRAVELGRAMLVPGNHDVKLARCLMGKKVNMAHGLEATMAAMQEESKEFLSAALGFLDGLISHAVLDGGQLVVAHAGIREDMQGRASSVVRAFCLYGDTTGEIDDFGLPVRLDWAEEYRGNALVVYGHVPVTEPYWRNNTVDIDTGCAFGGQLSALRYPEREIVAVDSRDVYAEPVRPLQDRVGALQEGVLDLEDVLGRRHIQTKMGPSILVKHENAVAAVEVMSRFAADPRWLVYLPPTMSPCETSTREGYLESPEQAFGYYSELGVQQVICEEKHMGSRAVLVVCRDETVGEKRFGVPGEAGIIVTRTGRRFFDELELEKSVLDRVRGVLDAAGFWDELGTDWVVLDCELMPWSAKAIGLLRQQYGAVGRAGLEFGKAAIGFWERVVERGVEGAEEFLARASSGLDEFEKFRAAYRRYCWNVDGVDDYRVAPFHVLATEGAVHMDKNHLWHMGWSDRFGSVGDPLVMGTSWRTVDLADEAQVLSATEWWDKLTGSGGEGMVVKPIDFLVKSSRGGIVQPAVKCRGKEYLRIIYGPGYTREDNLVRLRKRGLGRKRGLAIKEFALGMESLERFVRREPLSRVHECVFAVLALETELVDPRL